MYKLLALIFTAFLVPGIAAAHETHVFEIGGEEYTIVIGSRNEPIIVDDKTGVDLELLKGRQDVLGADQYLQVEISAGDKKESFNFEPVFGQPGRYRTIYFPTVATTLSYRLFGEINETPIDLTFTCNPVGHPQTEEDETRVEMSPGVIRTFKTGAFSCPQEKAGFGFPEPSESIANITARLQASADVPDEEEDTDTLPLILGLLGFIMGALALIVSVLVFVRSANTKT